MTRECGSFDVTVAVHHLAPSSGYGVVLERAR